MHLDRLGSIDDIYFIGGIIKSLELVPYPVFPADKRHVITVFIGGHHSAFYRAFRGFVPAHCVQTDPHLYPPVL